MIICMQSAKKRQLLKAIEIVASENHLNKLHYEAQNFESLFERITKFFIALIVAYGESYIIIDTKNMKYVSMDIKPDFLDMILDTECTHVFSKRELVTLLKDKKGFVLAERLSI